MFGSLRAWRAARKQRKLERYAGEYGHVDRDKLQHLREQQSPLRGMGGQRRRA